MVDETDCYYSMRNLTGVRSAMLNFEEISGSLGNSSLLMESTGHRIPFIVGGKSGKIAFTCVRVNMWVCGCVGVCIYVCVYMCACECMYVHMCVCVRMFACAGVCVCQCVRVCITDTDCLSLWRSTG